MDAAGSVRTTCPYCGVGCGVIATPTGTGVAITGDRAHPANAGMLCVKGTTLGETVSTKGRLLHPEIGGRRATWDEATGFVARRLRETIDRHGPDSIAFYLSGQLLTEDYYLANKLAKGFLGVANVDTNSRLCMASSVAGHRRAFGADVVPNAYEDLDEADLIVLVGSNAAWCHPILHRRMQAAKERRGTRIVVIDPRRTATVEGADLHLAIAHGMDAVLFAHLMVEIAARGAIDRAYVEAHTTGLDDALAAARALAPDLATVAARTGLAPADIARFAGWFAGTDRVVTCYSQGVNQSRQGTDKVNAILNCHLATGRIGRVGAGPFSLTGQPNAMGGREAGGLANMLAAHMNYTPAEVDRVRRFWVAPRMATREGLKAVAMFEAIEAGRIKALWVMHTNPVATLPRADAMRAALKKLDLLVVSEAMAATDTTAVGAHVLLPAAAWGEKDGTVTNSERRVSRQRAFRPPPGEAKPDWEHIARVGRAMGFAGFDHATSAAIFREHAALSAFENAGARAFDIGAIAAIDDEAYDRLAPFQWPWRAGEAPTARLFAKGGFLHADARARLIALADPAAPDVGAAYPFILNTGRLRDQWHTMTRTGQSPTLARHRGEPFVAVHPLDAARLELADGAYARLRTAHGTAILRVALDDGQPRGTVFAPMHWTDETAGGARIDALVHPITDPVSGQPDLKATPVSLAPAPMACEGFILTRGRVTPPRWLVHARVATEHGELLLFASPRTPAATIAALENLVPAGLAVTRLDDVAAARFARDAYAGKRPMVVMRVAMKRDEAAIEAALALFAADIETGEARRRAALGQETVAGPNRGPILCACHAVRLDAIEEAVRDGAATVEAIGQATAAGTNCGSCRPEIRRVLAGPVSQPA